MNLLQSVLGSVLGGGSQASQGGGMSGALLQMAMGMLAGNNAQGGAQGGGLLDQLRGAGMGNVLDSWIGKGANLPISAEQLQQVLGSQQLSDIASKLGIDASSVSGQLSEMLPDLVDKLTPDGQLPQGGFGNADAMMGMLQNILKR